MPTMFTAMTGTAEITRAVSAFAPRYLPVVSGVSASWRFQPLESSVTVLPLIATVFCTAPYSAMPIMTYAATLPSPICWEE